MFLLGVAPGLWSLTVVRCPCFRGIVVVWMWFSWLD